VGCVLIHILGALVHRAMTRPAVHRLASILLALAFVGALAAPAAAVDGDRYVALANQKRASVGLSPVALVAAVDQVSVERANQMAASDDFSHDMTYVVNRLKQLGVCFSGYGEIIAWESGYPTYDPARTMEQWWASSGHHAIIVGDYNAAGGSHATSSRTGRIYSAMVWVKLCQAPVAPAPTPTPSAPTTSISRLAGGDRYQTAAAISQARFPGGAGTVFLATGASFPDALAGAPAAARAGGPILLTTAGSIPAATAAELSRLHPSRIVVLGGPGVVGDAVVSQLSAWTGNVERWSGATRFETAAAVSRSTFAPGVPVAYLATARTFPDALAGGAVAGRLGRPILLVEPNGVPAATAAELARLRPSQVVVLGGAGVVSDGVLNAVRPYATSGLVARLAGADRYATSVAISRSAFGAGTDGVFIATGSNFPDGLAGGPVAALVPGPLLLVAPGQLPSSVAGELQRLSPDAVFVLGGAGVVSDGVVSQIDAVLP
jgi:putative cell wall-binding protein